MTRPSVATSYGEPDEVTEFLDFRRKKATPYMDGFQRLIFA